MIMANQRLDLLMKKTEVQYAVGSPLLLEASALYLDRTTNNCIAQLKWRNIDSRPVKAVMIELDSFDAFEQKLEPVHYQYDGMLVAQGSDFGGKIPILIKNNKAVKFSVIVKAVSFSDETIWRNDTLMNYADLPVPKPQSLTGTLKEQYERDLTKQGIKAAASYTPQSAMGLWQCGCGSWQLQDSPCLKCRSTQQFLASASQSSILEAHLKEYEAEQEKLRIEAEKKAEETRIARIKAEAEQKRRDEEIRRENERRKAEMQRIAAQKKRKRIKIVVALIVTLVIVSGAITSYIKIIKPNNTYKAAASAFDAGHFDEAYSLFTELGEYKDAGIRADESLYQKGAKLHSAGDYQEAISIYKRIPEYKDSNDREKQAEADMLYTSGNYSEAYSLYKTLGEEYQTHSSDYEQLYSDASTLLSQGEYEKAIDAFEAISSYSDANIQVLESKYQYGIRMIGDEKYTDAYQILSSILTYKDVSEIVNNNSHLRYEGLNSTYKVGAVVLFGRYEQDNDTDNGQEDLQWYVIERDGTEAFLVSKYAIDTHSYCHPGKLAWSSSTLRSWLNNTFYNTAFSEEEQEAIVLSTVDNSYWKYTGSTEDKLFILNDSEVGRYKPGGTEKCLATEYAEKKGLYNYSGCSYWLRHTDPDNKPISKFTGGQYQSSQYMMSSGRSYFEDVEEEIGVRPALRIDLEKCADFGF